jgi:hypothetical protein
MPLFILKQGGIYNMAKEKLGIKASTIRAYGDHVVGCKETKSDVMISFDDSEVEGYSIQDIFLTQAQAESFYRELGEVLQGNKENKK